MMQPTWRWHPKAWRTHYGGPPRGLLPFDFDADDGYLAYVVGEIRSKGSFVSGQTYRSEGDLDIGEYGPNQRHRLRASIEQLAWELMQAERRRLLHEQADLEWAASAP